jgi:hypothetical protein
MRDLDEIMEQASERLVAMDYVTCERLCVEALGLSRQLGDFERCARILLPLQESRRQRRQIAVEAGVHLFSGPRLSPDKVLEHFSRGCIMLLSPPYTRDDELAIRELARKGGQMVEVLAIDQDGLRQCFEQQMEREGDAAVASIPSGLPPEKQVDELAAVLDRVGDHEIAHQRLASAARQAARHGTTE